MLLSSILVELKLGGKIFFSFHIILSLLCQSKSDLGFNYKMGILL